MDEAKTGNEVICFVHRGNSRYLQYAVAQARSCGYNPIVIGDTSAKCKFAAFYDLDDFQDGVADFRNIYKHISINPVEYEMFCFERWLIIRNFLRVHPGPVWIADHDVLVYPGLNTLSALLRSLGPDFRVLNSAWFTYARNAGDVHTFVQYFCSIYEHEAELVAASERNAISLHPHLSDMHLLIDLSQARASSFIDAAYSGVQFGIDSNFREVAGFSSLDGHKRIRWREDRPHVVTDGGHELQYYCLHFQGPSKYLMQVFHNIEDLYRGDHLTDFTDDVARLQDDNLGRNIKAAFRRTRATTSNLICKSHAQMVPTQRRIFVDCGGHCGESVITFLKEFPDYEFYTFEPNPALMGHLLTNLSSTGRAVFFSSCAVWIYDGEVDLFLGHDQGSTVVRGKVEFGDGVNQIDYEHPIKVPCMDLSDWIRRNINRDDILVIKMDIEGAEYPVLSKMLKEATLDKVSILYCAWHIDRFPAISDETHDAILAAVGRKTDLRGWG